MRILCLLFFSQVATGSTLGEPQWKMETLDPKIRHFFVGRNFLILGPHDRSWLEKAPLTKDRVAKFTNRSRVRPFKKTFTGLWDGMAETKGGWLLLDGEESAVIRLDEKFNHIETRALITDNFRPAADPRGEPTPHEVQQARRKFLRESKKVLGSRLSSLERSRGQNHPQEYWVSTRVPGFPLMTVRCGGETGAQCALHRWCHLEPDPKTTDIAGLSVFEGGQKLALIVGRSIEFFHIHSCFHIKRYKSLKLGKGFADPSHLHIDEKGRLWVSTYGMRDRDNSSLFRWDAGRW